MDRDKVIRYTKFLVSNDGPRLSVNTICRTIKVIAPGCRDKIRKVVLETLK